MVEIIIRDIKPTKIEWVTKREVQMQVSYNSWGHLTIRIFNPNNPDRDILIVFDRMQTAHFLGFLRDIMKGIS